MITDDDVVSDHPRQWLSGSSSPSVSPPPAHLHVPPDDSAQEFPHSPLSSISPYLSTVATKVLYEKSAQVDRLYD